MDTRIWQFNLIVVQCSQVKHFVGNLYNCLSLTGHDANKQTKARRKSKGKHTIIITSVSKWVNEISSKHIVDYQNKGTVRALGGEL